MAELKKFMRLTRPILFAVCAICIVTSLFVWRLGDKLLERQDKEVVTSSSSTNASESLQVDKGQGGMSSDSLDQISDSKDSFELVSSNANQNPGDPMVNEEALSANDKALEKIEAQNSELNEKPLRLANSELNLDQMIKSDSGIILENALIDTDREIDLEIPEHLKSQGRVGAYIIQFSKNITIEEYELIAELQGEVISYIPNNALLVSGEAQHLEGGEGRESIKSVIPWEPYFKLKETLLGKAIEQEPLGENQWLYLTGFPGKEYAMRELIESHNAHIIIEEKNPFGMSMVVAPDSSDWISLALSDSIMAVEPFTRREILNDIARERLGVAPDTISSTNYFGLTGAGIPINVNDTGVDGSHPDLAGRVFPGDPIDVTTLSDVNGHGTHVAGSIASSGLSSPGPAEDGNPAALGSLPDANFRGMAPEASIYALPIELEVGPPRGDFYLISKAAELNYLSLNRTNPIISNNSWGYLGSYSYSSSSARYDAAVRDALETTSGDQPIVYVFAAGNEGEGDSIGGGGVQNTIRAPGNAKNVITVGAIENFRNITNDFTIGPEDEPIDLIAPFKDDTDTDNQVASFSSRGNTGIGIEGQSGRRKPDIVAPGTFVVSTWSGDAPDAADSIETDAIWLEDQLFRSDELTYYSYRVPVDARNIRIEIMNGNTPVDPNDLSFPMYAVYGAVPTVDDLIGNNFIEIPENLELLPGDILNYAVGNQTGDDQTYSIRLIIESIVPGGDDIENARQLLNDPVLPNYKFLDGTSMAAPIVTGILALFSEYLEQNGYTQSPALLKAMVINGARNINTIYSFSESFGINYQGWGVVNLTNSLPATPFSTTPSPVQFVDQSIENSLSTGEELSWDLTISEDAIEAESDLKVTLVWTDPPGNPSAGVKLVNDLDLVVTNHNATNYFLGNDIPEGTDYVLPAIETSAPDTINNVENIFIRGPLSTNYTIKVRGSRVNVNALKGHQNKIAQDFALVVSTTDNTVTNAITMAPTPIMTTQTEELTTITNGLALLYQRTSANSPILAGANGQTNQWKFYVFTNTFVEVDNPVLTNGPNVAFTTFLAPNLSSPKRNLSADVDLYVSRGDAGLLSLNPASIENASISADEGGTESVIFTDAEIGEIFYVGVKAEDQKGAEFSIMGISTDQPFSTVDDDGNHRFPGFPVGNLIPDGTPMLPGFEPVVVPGGQDILIQNVTVEASYYSENFGDILGKLSHNNKAVVLNNHSQNFGLPIVDGATALYDSFIYDDSNSGQIVSVGVTTSDGPGDLTQFIGDSAGGPWIFNLFDNAINNRTSLESFEVVVRELIDLNNGPINGSVLPQRFEFFAVEVPGTATSLEVFLSNIQPNLPLDLYVRRDLVPTLIEFDKSVSITPPGGSLTLTPNDSPPLNGGRYFVGVFNPNAETVSFTLNTVITDDADGVDLSVIALGLTPEEAIPILDHGTTESVLRVDEDERIGEMRVGVRVDHPRVSDLSFRIQSPQGDRFLLSEARGGVEADQLGSSLGDSINGLTNHSFAVFTIDTNKVVEPLKFTDPPYYLEPDSLLSTNRLLLEEDFQDVENGIYTTDSEVGEFTVTLDAVEVVGEEDEENDTDRGVILGTRSGRSGGLAATFKTQSGRDYIITFEYELLRNGTGGVQIYTNNRLASFDTYRKSASNLRRTVTIPLRARSTETTFQLRSSLRANRAELKSVTLEEAGVLEDFYVRPEETLESMTGKRGLGEWKLLISDDRAGANDNSAKLLDWKLEFIFANPDIRAITLTNGIVYSGILTNGTRAYFKVPVPRGATIATNILDGEGDLVLLGDRQGAPIGPLDTIDSEIDYFEDFFGEDLGEYLEISTNSPPVAPLEPGNVYYLGVDNADPSDDRDLEFQIRVTFDADDPFDDSGIPELVSGETVTNTIPVGPEMVYYKFTVEDEEISSIVDLLPIDDNLDLFVSKSLLPTFSVFDVWSANLDLTPEQTTLMLDPQFDRLDQFNISPGTWYVGILNRSADQDVEFNLTYTEGLADITDLVDSAITDAGTVGTEAFRYFRFSAPGPTTSLTIDTIDATGPIDLVAVRGAPVPSFSRFDVLGVGDGNDKTISMDRESQTLLNGDWYIAVYNADPNTPVDFKIRVSSQVASFIDLEDRVPHSDELGWGGFIEDQPIKYFRYDVSPNAEALTIQLFNKTGPDNLDLLVVDSLDNGLPSDDNFAYQTTVGGLAEDRLDIRATSLPAPIHPGPWYIAVIHRGTDGTLPPVEFDIVVTEKVTQITELVVDVSVTSQGLLPGFEEYYKFTVEDETQAIRLSVFDILGDVDVYIRKDGLPTPGKNDADSTTAGQTTETVFLSKYFGATRLEPGEYFVTVRNVGSITADYTIRYEEKVDSFSVLEPGIEESEEIRFLGEVFKRELTTPAETVELIIRNLRTGGATDLDIYASRTTRFPTPSDFEFESASYPRGGNRERIRLAENGGFLSQEFTFDEEMKWFISFNSESQQPGRTYRIVADTVIGLDLDSTTQVQGLKPNQTFYYRVRADQDADTLFVKLKNTTGDLDLRADRWFSLDGFRTFDRRPTNEEPNDLTVPNSWTLGSFFESTGYLYISVTNPTDQPVDFDLDISTDLVITELFNGIPVNGTQLVGENDLERDYFKVVIPEEATKATITLYNLTYNATLVVKKGRNPLPSFLPRNYDAHSRNSGPQDEVIELVPEPGNAPFRAQISPGEWFITVEGELSNQRPAVEESYTIRVDLEGVDPGGVVEIITPDIILEGTDICLTWDADIGSRYRIEGLRTVNGDNWESITTIVADETPEKYCLAESDLEYVLFRVAKLAPPSTGGPDVPIEVSGITVKDGNELCLTWQSQVGRTYLVERRDTLIGEWQQFGSRIPGTGDVIELCIPVAEDVLSFFRVLESSEGGVSTPPVEVTSVTVVTKDNEVCLQWEPEAGFKYDIEKSNDFGQTWTTVRSDYPKTFGETAEYCHEVTEGVFELLRVMKYTVGDPPASPPEEVSAVTAVTKDNEVCLQWEPEAGFKYDIEKSNDFGQTWTTVTTDHPVTFGETAEYCYEVTEGVFELLRVMKYTVGNPPAGPPEEVSSVTVGIVDNDVCLKWDPESGMQYDVEISDDLGATWRTLSSNVTVTVGQEAQYCHTAVGDKVELLRIMQYRVGTSPNPGPVSPIPSGTEIGGIALNSNAEGLQLTWEGVQDVSYRIEGLMSVNGDWETVRTDITGSELISIDLDESTGYLFFRVIVN